MSQLKRSPDSKRTNPPRDAKKAPKFLKDWENLSRSGKHDLNVLKEAMMLLIANDVPLPAEWKDHQLHETARDLRECHIKGDLLLIYRAKDDVNVNSCPHKKGAAKFPHPQRRTQLQ